MPPQATERTSGRVRGQGGIGEERGGSAGSPFCLGAVDCPGTALAIEVDPSAARVIIGVPILDRIGRRIGMQRRDARAGGWRQPGRAMAFEPPARGSAKGPGRLLPVAGAIRSA